jgi:hypothetical protein
VIDDHQRIHVSKRVDFGRQRAFLTYRRPLQAPVIDGLFQFWQ